MVVLICRMSRPRGLCMRMAGNPPIETGSSPPASTPRASVRHAASRRWVGQWTRLRIAAPTLATLRSVVDDLTLPEVMVSR